MLIEIMDNLFISNCYKQVHVELSNNQFQAKIYAAGDSQKKQEYFAIIEFVHQAPDTLRKILEHHSYDIFTKIDESNLVESWFRKNCTLVICSKEEKSTKQDIFALEEDLYNFKKNVITYTSDEIDSLNHVIERPPCVGKLTVEAANTLINSDNGGKFRDYKEANGQTNDFYSLLMKISAKIPFMHYTPAKRSLENLDQNIAQRLSDNQANIYTAAVSLDPTKSEAIFEEQILKLWTSL